MAEIKHFIVLMMENRSFDHMLGFLESPTYGIDGVSGAKPNVDSAGTATTVNRNARYSGDLAGDPHHDFDDVTEQLFGTRTPAPGQQPDMSGFVRNYERYAGTSDAPHIMNCFDPPNLPVLTALAKAYAVCDRWFCSVPGPTLPNRLYAHAGTSRGRLDMSPDYIGGFRTIYEVLWGCEVESAIFYHDWSGTLSFDFMLTHQSDMYASFDRFVELCGNDRLPAYCFIEPRYNPQSAGGFLPANDQHPDHDVAAGELLVRRVYEALRSNPNVWTSSLLLIVYDEHGGIYDHVPPGSCDSPDGMRSVSPAFDFTRYGPRVPAVIVSPYVKAGTIVHDRVCDHTSIIATAIRLFATKDKNPKGIDWPSNVLGVRAMNAKAIDDLLDLTAVPRMETPPFGAHALAAAGPPAAAATPISALQREAVNHAAAIEARLPADRQTGVKVGAIGTEQQAGAYVSAVTNNALQAKKDGALVR